MRAPDLRAYQSFVFDVDGVILDSNTLKSDAFKEALAEYDSEIVQTFVAYHKAHGGVSRYVKFEYFFAEMLGLSEFEESYERALANFARICRSALEQAAMVPGVEAVLASLNARSKHCFVISGGDQTELREVFAVRGQDHYFDAIQGSPKNKVENADLLLEQGAVKGPAIFFGDAESDMLAAEHAGWDFCFVSGLTEWGGGAETALAHGHFVIEDFIALASQSG